MPTPRRNHSSRDYPLGGLPVAAAALIVLVAVHAAAAQPEVTVEGGPDEDGIHYQWEIRHDYPSPLVAIDFEHYMADTFEPPAPTGWKLTFTGRVGEGRITVEAESPANGIPRGRPARIVLKTGRIGAQRATRLMHFRFADGTTVDAPAMLPSLPPPGDQYGPLIGLGAIFGGFILYRIIKSRRKSDSPPKE